MGWELSDVRKTLIMCFVKYVLQKDTLPRLMECGGYKHMKKART